MERKVYASNGIVSLAEYLRDADDPANYENWLDPATQAGYNYRMTATYEEYRAMQFRYRFSAVIIRSADQAVIGSITLSPENAPPDLAINVYRPFRGQGLGSAAFALALEYCFEAFGFEEIYAGCYEHNAASLKMLKKCGFVPHPEGNCAEEHFLTGEPVTQLDFVKRRCGLGGIQMEQICQARRFVSDVAELARKYGLNFFVITDGASGMSNTGNAAIEHARKCHTEWEIAHGIDPEHDWSNEAE